MGLVNTRVRKTNGGHNRLVNAPGIKTSACHNVKKGHKKGTKKKRERRERKGRRGEIAKPGPWIFGTLLLKSKTVSFTKPMFSYMPLVENLPTIKPAKGVVVQPPT